MTGKAPLFRCTPDAVVTYVHPACPFLRVRDTAQRAVSMRFPVVTGAFSPVGATIWVVREGSFCKFLPFLGIAIHNR
jgi:hypothetical protein